MYVGWPRDIKDLIQVLDELVIPGSELWLFSEVSPVVSTSKWLFRFRHKLGLRQSIISIVVVQ